MKRYQTASTNATRFRSEQYNQNYNLLLNVVRLKKAQKEKRIIAAPSLTTTPTTWWNLLKRYVAQTQKCSNVTMGTILLYAIHYTSENKNIQVDKMIQSEMCKFRSGKILI